MLLGGLMKALFARGITLVATSNIPPDELYRNGLQRARFLPAIDAIKQHCDIMNVDAGVDYRLRTLTQAHLWLSPLNEETRQQMDKLWLALAGTKGEHAPTLEINHRPMQTLAVETKRWRCHLPHSVSMRVASMTTLRCRVCFTRYCCLMCRS